jgi:hypothetical protein
MSKYSGSGTYSEPAEWLLGTARRNPEALLLVGAGLCLLMRGASWGSERARVGAAYRQERDSYQPTASLQTHQASGSQSTTRDLMSQAGEAVSRAADTAAEYASNVKQRVTDAAGTYADTVSRYTQETGRSLYRGSERLGRQAQMTAQETMGRIVREQPLAVAAMGLAAGAAIAAIFPSTRLESRSFGGAREALGQAASKVGENLVGVATQAGERLAGQAAQTFANTIKGSDTGGASPPIAPQHPSSGSEPGRSGIAAAGSAASTRNRP